MKCPTKHRNTRRLEGEARSVKTHREDDEWAREVWRKPKKDLGSWL